MQYITVSQSCVAVLRIPESASTDTVTYNIRKASDGSVFASGNATSVAAGSKAWKVTFTPTVVNEVYILEIYDATIDREVADEYKAVQDQPVATDESEAATAAQLLAKVNAAISSRLTGGGVNSYKLQDGRDLEYMSLDELRLFRKELKGEISATKTSKQTTAHVRFHRPL